MRCLCTSLAPPALTGAGERAAHSRRSTRGPQGAALLSRQGVGGLTFRASAADMLERVELATATHQARRGGVSEQPGLCVASGTGEAVRAVEGPCGD